MPDEIDKNNAEVKKVIEKTILPDSSSTIIKQHLDEINKTIDYDNKDDPSQETALKLVKLLERKRRKTAKIERKKRLTEKLDVKDKDDLDSTNVKQPKYINCNQCKNPQSCNCEWKLCRKCCKEKIFSEKIECKGHGLKFRIKTDNN